MSYDSRPDTHEHIGKVRGYLLQVVADLLDRAHNHDRSKLEDPELAVFDEFTPKLRDSTYGSDEYKGYLRGMGHGLQHHYLVNDHHPEHFAGGDPVAHYSGGWPDSCWRRQEEHGLTGIAAMDLVQMTEMLADWKAATERHADGDLRASIEKNAERFGYGTEVRNLLLLTAERFGWL